MPQHVYLDASIILPHLWEDADPDWEAHTATVLDDLRGAVHGNHDIHVKIPHLAVGECVMRFFEDLDEGAIYREPPEDQFMENVRWIADRTRADFVSTNTNCYSLAQELHRRESFIQNNDLFIACTAMDDPYSTHLLTTDMSLIESREIPAMCRERDHHVHGIRVDNRYSR